MGSSLAQSLCWAWTSRWISPCVRLQIALGRECSKSEELSTRGDRSPQRVCDRRCSAGSGFKCFVSSCQVAGSVGDGPWGPRSHQREERVCVLQQEILLLKHVGEHLRRQHWFAGRPVAERGSSHHKCCLSILVRPGLLLTISVTRNEKQPGSSRPRGVGQSCVIFLQPRDEGCLEVIAAYKANNVGHALGRWFRY